MPRLDVKLSDELLASCGGTQQRHSRGHDAPGRVASSNLSPNSAQQKAPNDLSSDHRIQLNPSLAGMYFRNSEPIRASPAIALHDRFSDPLQVVLHPHGLGFSCLRIHRIIICLDQDLLHFDLGIHDCRGHVDGACEVSLTDCQEKSASRATSGSVAMSRMGPHLGKSSSEYRSRSCRRSKMSPRNIFFRRLYPDVLNCTPGRNKRSHQARSSISRWIIRELTIS